MDALTGKAIAGAKVRVSGLGSDREDLEVHADASGRFRAEGLSRTRELYVRVSAPGYVERSRWKFGPLDDITVSLSPSSRLFGKVTDPEGKPVEGVLVFVDGVYGEHRIASRPREDSELFRRFRGVSDPERFYEFLAKRSAAAVTDAAGRYEAKDVPVSQSLTLLASAAGFSPSSPMTGVTIPPGSAGQEVDLVLRPDTTLVLRVEVPGGTDAPRNVTAAVDAPLAPRILRPSGDGSWSIGGLPGGRTWYLVEAPPLAVVYESVEVEPGKRNEVVVKLGAGDGISGRVVDADRHGVGGVHVEVKSAVKGAPDVDLGSGDVTDDAGRFVVRGLADGGYNVTVVDRKAIVIMKHGTHRAPSAGLVLPAMGSLRFRVVAPEGTPMPAAKTFTVSHSPDGDRYLHVAFWQWNLSYDPETGVVDVHKTFPGKTTLAVKVPEFVEVRRTMEVPAGGAADFGDIVLVPSLRATGRVLDPAGKPVANARVTAWYSGGVSASSKTDLAGAFVLRDLAPGEVTVEIHDEGHQGQLFALATWKRVISAGMAPLEFTLQPGGPVRVRVVDSKGLPVTLSLVTCEPEGSRYRAVPRSLEPAEAEGEFTGRRMPGPMVVQALDPDRPNPRKPFATTKIEVREDREVFVEIKLPE